MPNWLSPLVHGVLPLWFGFCTHFVSFFSMLKLAPFRLLLPVSAAVSRLAASPPRVCFGQGHSASASTQRSFYTVSRSYPHCPERKQNNLRSCCDTQLDRIVTNLAANSNNTYETIIGTPSKTAWKNMTKRNKKRWHANIESQIHRIRTCWFNAM